MKRIIAIIVFFSIGACSALFSQEIMMDSIEWNNERDSIVLSLELNDGKDSIIDEMEAWLTKCNVQLDRCVEELGTTQREMDALNEEILSISDEIFWLRQESEIVEEENRVLESMIEAMKVRYENDSSLWAKTKASMEDDNYSLRKMNDTLSEINKDYRQQLTDINQLLEEKIKILQQKEILFAEKEQVYKDAINSTTLDKTKVEGLVEAKNALIEGKEKEIDLLQRNINEKEASIMAKNQDLSKIVEEKERYYLMSDTLRTKLVEAEKIILQREEELKYVKKRAEEAEAKIATATSRKKKVRVIQGIAMRYPTPNWDISPKSVGVDEYENVIYNKNASVVEFDFVTGASVMLLDLTKEGSQFSHDLSVYVGFGGANLFKNFYLGPSYRFLDFFHVTAGINVAEYTMLAEKFNKEGDSLKPGWSIKTTSRWKVTPFLSLSLDLDFLSYMGKK